MPHYQPGQHRYFGSMPKPVASITSSILSPQPPLTGLDLTRVRRPIRPPKPSSYSIGRKERGEITQHLLKSPHYIPRESEKSLRKFAKIVLGNKKAYSKAEVVFAEATAHRDRVIRDTSQQKKFIEGEAEALVATHDSRVKNPYRFTHQTAEVAGETLRTMVKEKQRASEEPAKRTRYREPERSDSIAPNESPHIEAVQEPMPLSGSETISAAAGWGSAFLGAPTSGMHASQFHETSGGSSNPAVQAPTSAVVMILTDRYSPAVIQEWGTKLNSKLISMPLSSAGLVRTLTPPPRTLVLDLPGETAFDPHRLAGVQIPVVLFAPQLSAPAYKLWMASEASIRATELTLETLGGLLNIESAETNHPASTD